MKFPLIIRITYAFGTPIDHQCNTHAEYEEKMARARNSTAKTIQVFEFSYSLNLNKEWAIVPAITQE